MSAIDSCVVKLSKLQAASALVSGPSTDRKDIDTHRLIPNPRQSKPVAQARMIKHLHLQRLADGETRRDRHAPRHSVTGHLAVHFLKTFNRNNSVSCDRASRHKREAQTPVAGGSVTWGSQVSIIQTGFLRSFHGLDD